MNSTEQNKCGDSTCRAAGNSLHKKRNLCETGLEIAGCRHSMAQKAVNMMYGEIYGYAHYLQKTYFIPKRVKYFWYDDFVQKIVNVNRFHPIDFDEHLSVILRRKPQIVCKCSTFRFI